MTGAYLRVERDGKWENIEVEHLTNEERKHLLGDDPRIIEWLNLLCDTVVDSEKILDELVEEGVITK